MSTNNLNDDIETIEEAQFRLEERKWATRKNIAQRSFYALVAIVIAVFAVFIFKDDIEKFTAIENVVITIVFGLVSIIGFYFGSSTWVDMKNLKMETKK